MSGSGVVGIMGGAGAVADLSGLWPALVEAG